MQLGKQMSRKNQAKQARTAFDARLSGMREDSRSLARPQGGWIKGIRIALGMSAKDLASRMKIDASTLSRLETSEVAGRINLESLNRAAEALNCDLVYAFVPRAPLEQIVSRQAQAVARASLEGTNLTMGLESQALPQSMLEQLVAERAKEIEVSSQLWRQNASK
jgi:predicted DNA-binding mobile mystery protein A